MAFLDELFGNVSADPMGYGGPQEGMMDKFGELFKDQNFVRGLGEAGKGFSSGGNAGEVFGDFSTNLVRRRQAQKAAGQTRKAGQTFQEKLLDAIRGGSVLSSKEDNEAFDSFSLDGDGNVSLSMKNTPAKLGYKTNQPLEAVRRPSSGGSDLPDFSNQSSGGNIDFAGLDPEDIAMLLKAEQHFGELSQRDAQLILQEKGRREAMVLENQRRQEDLQMAAAAAKQARADKQAEAKAKVLADKTLQDRYDAREILKERLQSNLTPEEREEARLKNLKLNKEISKLEAETGKIKSKDDTGLTPAETLALDKDTKDTMQKIASAGVIFGTEKVPKVSIEEGAQLASFENNKPGTGVVYATEKVPTVKESWLWDFGLFDGEEEIDVPTPYTYPKDLTFYGKPATGAEIIKRAKAANMTVPEFLEVINKARK